MIPLIDFISHYDTPDRFHFTLWYPLIDLFRQSTKNSASKSTTANVANRDRKHLSHLVNLKSTVLPVLSVCSYYLKGCSHFDYYHTIFGLRAVQNHLLIRGLRGLPARSSWLCLNEIQGFFRVAPRPRSQPIPKNDWLSFVVRNRLPFCPEWVWIFSLLGFGFLPKSVWLGRRLGSMFVRPDLPTPSSSIPTPPPTQRTTSLSWTSA